MSFFVLPPRVRMRSRRRPRLKFARAQQIDAIVRRPHPFGLAAAQEVRALFNIEHTPHRDRVRRGMVGDPCHHQGTMTLMIVSRVEATIRSKMAVGLEGAVAKYRWDEAAS
jgi:hypothetical protein